MPATALLKFAIDAVDGPDGQVAELAFADLPKDVVVKNSNNTGVGSWQLDLLYSPPGATTPATLELAFADDAFSPLEFTLPINLPGSWRLRLKVWNGANRTGTPTDIDIRNVMAKTAAGFHIPPPQVFPLPLPTLSSGLPGAKPNEANLGGREDLGWSGNASDGLLNHFLRVFTPSTGGGGPGYGIMFVYAVFGYTPSETPDGSMSKPFTTFTEAHAALPAAGGVIYVLAADGSSDAPGLVFSKPLAVIADLPQQWGDGSHSVTSSAVLYVENMTVTTDEGGQPGILSAAGLVCKRCTAQFQSSAGFDLYDCTAQGGSLMHAAEGARLRDCNVATALGCAGVLELQDCVITGNLSSNDVLARFTTCRWTVGTRTVTFTGSAGVMEVDDYSNTRWKAAIETLTNGTLSVISSAITAHDSLSGLTSADSHTQYYPTAPVITALTGASNTLALAHLRTFCTLSHTATTTLTVPTNATVPFPIGSIIPFARIGVGAIVVAPAGGVTIIVLRGSLRCMGEAHLRKVATDTWVLSGDESAHDYNLVKDFGADPTGTTAADTVLAAFLTEVTAAGGGATLNIPRGTFKVTARFDITIDHVSLIFSAGAKFKKFGTDFSAIGLTGNFNELHGPEIDGNNQAQGTGIIVTGSNNKVMRAWVHNVGDVTDPSSYAHGSHGICLDGQATTCQFNEVAHCLVIDCHDIGISHNKATDSRILSNRVWNNGLEGVTCDNDSDRCQFIGNRLRGNCINGGAGGASADSSDLCEWTSNITTATAGGKPGFITNNNLAGGCNYWTFQANHWIDNGTASATWGLYFKHGTGGDSTFNTVGGNVFRGNGSGGGTVRFDAGCNNNKCYGNSLNGVAVSDAGTGNTGAATTVN